MIVFLKGFKDGFYIIFLLNIADRIQEKSLKFGNELISLNFQGDNSVNCSRISCGWSSRSEKKIECLGRLPSVNVL